MPKLRVALYVRVSSDQQIDGYSLHAQRRECSAWIAGRGGVVAGIYEDAGLTGRNVDRADFIRLQRDAAAGKFDAVIVHQWDRLARNNEDARAVKAQFRRAYGLTVHSVTEQGIDDTLDDSGLVMETFKDLQNDLFSRNLSREVSKARREAHAQGIHIGSAPIGYDKLNKRDLTVNEREAESVRLAFELYATGSQSWMSTADELNGHGYKRKNGKPFTRESMRSMLINRVYIGEVGYQKQKHNARGQRVYTEPNSWIPGKHPAIVDRVLFDAVQAVTERRAHVRGRADYVPYMLRGLVHCYRCAFVERPDAELTDTWARMYHRTGVQRSYGKHPGYYVCDRYGRGYGRCEQRAIPSADLEKTVIAALTDRLKPGTNWREQAIAAIVERTGDRDLPERLAALRIEADHMDQRFDKGFINASTYDAKRQGVQTEIDALNSLLTLSDDLIRAADVLNNFGAHLTACEGDPTRQNELLRQILRRIYIQGNERVYLDFQPDYLLLIDIQLRASAAALEHGSRNVPGESQTHAFEHRVHRNSCQSFYYFKLSVCCQSNSINRIESFVTSWPFQSLNTTQNRQIGHTFLTCSLTVPQQ